MRCLVIDGDRSITQTGMMSTRTSVLASHLNERKRRNQRFSLRAFAKTLDISPGQLSGLINGKKNLTPKQAAKIIEKLNLSEQEALDLIREMHPNLTPAEPPPHESQVLSDDEFRTISSWEHFAILSLSKIKSNCATGAWIAEALAIDVDTAEAALQRLKRLGFIKFEGGKFRQTTRPLSTRPDIPSRAIRDYHQQNLQIASRKLETVPVEERYFGSTTMAVNPRKLAKAKKLIEELKQKICDELETANATEVYTIAFQLFPLTVPGGRS